MPGHVDLTRYPCQDLSDACEEPLVIGTDGRFAGFEQPIVDEGHDASVGALLDGHQATFDLADEKWREARLRSGFHHRRRHGSGSDTGGHPNAGDVTGERGGGAAETEPESEEDADEDERGNGPHDPER